MNGPTFQFQHDPRFKALADWQLRVDARPWSIPTGELISDDPELTIYRHGSARSTYSLAFVRGVTFTADFASRTISVATGDRADDEIVRHYLGNQVIPRLLGHSGVLVLHAAAVGHKESGAILLVGPSGSGKSTLAASFFAEGRPLLGDDAIKVVEAAGKVGVEAVYQSLRLFPDSLGAVLPAGNFKPVVTGALKQQAVYFGNEKPEGVLPVRTIAFLDPGIATDIRVTYVSASSACLALLEHSFWLDSADRARVQRHIVSAGMLTERSRAVRLTFPHNYIALASVREAIEAVSCEAAG